MRPSSSRARDCREDALNNRLQSDIKQRRLEDADPGEPCIEGQVEHQRSDRRDGSRMQPIKPGVPHHDGVASPCEAREEKQGVADILRCSNGAASSPNDTPRAEHNEDEADPLLRRLNGSFRTIEAEKIATINGITPGNNAPA